MIPVTTQVTAEQYAGLRPAIARRRAEIKTCTNPERALWLIEECEHLEELIKNQKPIEIRPPKGYENRSCAIR